MKRNIVSIIVCVFCFTFVFGQQKNIIKTNLGAYVLKNINLQYERVLTKRSSLALAVPCLLRAILKNT